MLTFKALPAWAKTPLRPIRDAALRAPYYGLGRWCAVCCRSSRRFLPGRFKRPEAVCVHCGALERMRLAWLYFTTRTNLFDGRPRRMLHVAPERCFEPLLRARLGSGYLTADIQPGRADVVMDLTAIQYDDATFDTIYCSHVLEHIPDDRKAMAELRRVLKPDGWAVLLVPVDDGPTFEDSTITDEVNRLAHFGQEDHVRRYGPDYVDRLREARFDVTVTTPMDLCGGLRELKRAGLATRWAGDIYTCTASRSGSPVAH